MFKNMVTSLFKHDRIRTTDVKAKELRRWADHIITLAKRGDLHARRQVLAIVQEKDVVHKIFEEAGKRFGAINGGYTRLIKIGRRPGDAAPVSIIELVAAEEKTTAKKKTKGSAKKQSGEPQTKSTDKAAKTKSDDSAAEEAAGASEEKIEAPAQASEAIQTEAEPSGDVVVEAAAPGDDVEAPVEKQGQEPEEPEQK